MMNEGKELTRTEKENLIKEITKCVKQYFYESGYGYCKPYISFSQFDILHYTFSFSQQRYNANASYILSSEKEYELNTFRKEVRTIFKNYGFKKVKFDIKGRKFTYEWYGVKKVETRKELCAIYFDWN